MTTEYNIKFTGHCAPCANRTPHAPHQIEIYNTTRFGELDTYCPGIPGDGIEILVIKHTPGAAAYPAVFKAKVRQNT